MIRLGVIPARWASTRFPGKPLATLAGRPMIEHVYRRVEQADGLSHVVVATDDPRIRDAVTGFGGRAVMTSREHPSGTDRVCEAAEALAADLVINIQGDEPLLDPGMVEELLALLEEPDAEMATLARRGETGQAEDPNRVKVVLDQRGFALYFSRARIPYTRSGSPAGTVLEHVGIYGYRMETLRRFTRLQPSPLEQTEQLEQLRALENGIPIRVGLTERWSLGVDTPEDLQTAEEAMRSQQA